MTEEEKIFKEYLKRRRLKFTPERRAILAGIFSFHRHFDAEELYQRLWSKRRGLSRATIYRTLPLLVKSGLVAEALRCQGRVSYEHTFGHRHHDHMICLKCGKVIEFRDEEAERLQGSICKKYGFKAIEHRLGIKGYCRDCLLRAKRS